tara:strand:- start:1404 stop:2558 length:1155 start_codon:yes stop_codon:yes gene_type:complete
MNRNFLQEAIADAKAVKESAIANAKVALEEAFSPQVQAMFASKLEEMEKDEEVNEAYDDVDEAKDDEISEKKEYMTKKEKREGDDRKSDNKAETETEKMRKIKEEEEMDLDEILAELEKDEDLKENARTDAEEEGYKDGMKDEKEDLKEDERTDAEEEGFLDGEKDEKEDMDEDDEDIDLEDMSEEDLKKFIEDVIEDMVSAGEIEAGESFEDDVDVDVDADGEIEIEDDEETSVDVAEAKDDIDEYGKEEIDEAKDEMDEVKKDLDEAMKTVATLRSELNEINLLNAKLLYTNKVFRGKNLSENQKVKVLGAFDKAETVKEVKLVFETINSSVKSKTTNNSISEGFRAKGSASNMSAPKTTKKQPIVESDEMVARFKKLAGII